MKAIADVQGLWSKEKGLGDFRALAYGGDWLTISELAISTT